MSDAHSWRIRARRVEQFARRRDDAETYGRAAGLLARIYRTRLAASSIAGMSADMAALHAHRAAWKAFDAGRRR